jgi:hypothetical protein
MPHLALGAQLGKGTDQLLWHPAVVRYGSDCDLLLGSSGQILP